VRELAKLAPVLVTAGGRFMALRCAGDAVSVSAS
jgi:hypothetical protein